MLTRVLSSALILLLLAGCAWLPFGRRGNTPAAPKVKSEKGSPNGSIRGPVAYGIGVSLVANPRVVSVADTRAMEESGRAGRGERVSA
jgi:hypothetical protein